MRRSSRIPKQIPILLVGSDMEGKVFSEKAKTVLLSRHGAGIVSEYKLSAEQELILRSLETNREAEVRVVGQLGSVGGSHTYGVAFLDQNIDFWGIEFPPVSQSEKEANRVLSGAIKPTARAVNLSTRVNVQSGENVAIGGFIISGTQPKRLVLRGIGPSLTQHDVQGAALSHRAHGGIGTVIGRPHYCRHGHSDACDRGD
jgi:hypothetical protein